MTGYVRVSPHKGVTSTGVPKSNATSPDNRQQLIIAAFAAAEKAAIELEAVIVHDGVSRKDPKRGDRLLAELADGQLLAATDGTRHAWLRGDRFVMRSRGIKLVHIDEFIVEVDPAHPNNLWLAAAAQEYSFECGYLRNFCF